MLSYRQEQGIMGKKCLSDFKRFHSGESVMTMLLVVVDLWKWQKKKTDILEKLMFQGKKQIVGLNSGHIPVST